MFIGIRETNKNSPNGAIFLKGKNMDKLKTLKKAIDYGMIINMSTTAIITASLNTEVIDDLNASKMDSELKNPMSWDVENEYLSPNSKMVFEIEIDKRDGFSPNHVDIDKLHHAYETHADIADKSGDTFDEAKIIYFHNLDLDEFWEILDEIFN